MCVCARDYSISTKKYTNQHRTHIPGKKENVLTTKKKKEKCTLQHQYSMHAPGGGVVRVCMSAAQLVTHTRPGEWSHQGGGNTLATKKKETKKKCTLQHQYARTSTNKYPHQHRTHTPEKKNALTTHKQKHAHSSSSMHTPGGVVRARVCVRVRGGGGVVVVVVVGGGGVCVRAGVCVCGLTSY